MNKLQEALHEKRKATKDHIRQLQQEGKAGVRYTATMPDIPFLVLGVLSDVGWLMHLIAGILYFCRNGVRSVPDGLALAAMAGILFGVGFLTYLNRIHEKEIATKLQKDLSFGMTAYAGLAGAIVGMLQMLTAGVSPELLWLVIGGILNFAGGLPIFLSFRKGISYGIQ